MSAFLEPALEPAPSASVIPVIDLGPLRDNSNPQAVARELHAANLEIGFCYVRNHGISAEIIERARSVAFDFFQLSAGTKERVRLDSWYRGWIVGESASQSDGRARDLKETFVWGAEGVEGTTSDHPLRGPNRWAEGVPGLREAAGDFFSSGHELSRHILRAIALGLGLEESFFVRGYANPMSRGTLVYYPPDAGHIKSGRFGVSPHTDFGVITILAQDAIGGLEVQGRDGAWVSATPIEDTLVVNVGDLLERWTNGAYTATPHRVINRSERARLSLVLNCDPDAGTVIDASPLCAAGVAPLQAPITCGDYLVWRFERSLGDTWRDTKVWQGAGRVPSPTHTPTHTPTHSPTGKGD